MFKNTHASDKIRGIVGHHMKIMSIRNNIDTWTLLHVDAQDFGVLGRRPEGVGPATFLGPYIEYHWLVLLKEEEEPCDRSFSVQLQVVSFDVLASRVRPFSFTRHTRISSATG